MKQDTERRLQQAFRDLRRRDLHRNAVEGAVWGLVAWLTLAILLSGAARLWPWLTRAQVGTVLLLAAGPCVLIGAAGCALWPRPTRRWLLTCDARLGLAERLTTAWEIAHHHLPVTPTLAQAQWEDTLQALARADVRTAFRPRWPRALPWGAATLLILLLPLMLLPNPRERDLARRAALRQAAETQAAQLEAARATVAQTSTLTPEQRAAALQALDEAIRSLRDARSSPEEQQAALRQAEQQLAQVEATVRPTAAQAMAQAAPLDTPAVVQPLVEALRRGDLQTAEAYLREITHPANPPLTPEEQQALGEALAQMGAALSSTAPELAQAMQKAGEALQAQDPQARSAVTQLAGMVAELAQQQASAQRLEQARARAQNAQAELAQAQKSINAPSTSGGQERASQRAGGSAQGGNGGANASGSGSEGSGSTTISGHSEDSGTGAPYGNVTWERLTSQGGNLTLPRERLQGSGQGESGLSGNSTVSYREIYAQYNRAAEASLERQAYPATLRDYVRDYFASLAP